MNLIVVLCKDWIDACDTFDSFVSYLDEYSPDSILECYENVNIVDTIEPNGISGDDHFRYLFTDYHFGPWFEEMDQNEETKVSEVNVIDADSFFNGILEYYQWVLI